MQTEEKFDLKGFIINEAAKQLGVKSTKVADFDKIPKTHLIVLKFLHDGHLADLGITEDSDEDICFQSVLEGETTVGELVNFLKGLQR